MRGDDRPDAVERRQSRRRALAPASLISASMRGELAVQADQVGELVGGELAAEPADLVAGTDRWPASPWPSWRVERTRRAARNSATRSRWRRFTHWVRRPTSSRRRCDSSRSATRRSSGAPRADPVCAARPARWSARRCRRSCGRCRRRTPAPARPGASTRPPRARRRRPAAAPGACRHRCSPRSPRSAAATDDRTPAAHGTRSTVFGELPARQHLARVRSTTTTALSRLCGSTPITTLATLLLLVRSSDDEREEGSATSSVAFPSRATPRTRCPAGSEPFASHTSNRWAARSRATPPRHLSSRLACLEPQPGYSNTSSRDR